MLKFADIKWGSPNGQFTTKTVKSVVSAPYSNNGYESEGYFKIIGKNEAKQHLTELVEKDFAFDHPEKTFPGYSTYERMMKTNPVAAKVYYDNVFRPKYAEAAKKYALQKEPLRYNNMLQGDMYGLKGDKKPRRNAQISSSWVAKGGKITYDGRSATITMGGKSYTYPNVTRQGFTNFLQSNSPGAFLNKVKKFGSYQGWTRSTAYDK